MFWVGWSGHRRKARFMKSNGGHCRGRSDQICLLLPTSLSTAASYVKSAKKSRDTTAFVARWVITVEKENNVGNRFLTVDGCFEVPRER